MDMPGVGAELQEFLRATAPAELADALAAHAEAGGDALRRAEQIGDDGHRGRPLAVARVLENQSGAAGDEHAAMRFRQLVDETDGRRDALAIAAVGEEAQERLQIAERRQFA